MRVVAVTATSANKILYSASVSFPTAGRWRVRIVVGTTSCETELAVLPAQPPLLAYWPYFAIVPAGIGLFALNQALKRRRQNRRP